MNIVKKNLVPLVIAAAGMLVLWLGCSEKDNPASTIYINIDSSDVYYDTVAHDTVTQRDTNALFDSTVADTTIVTYKKSTDFEDFVITTATIAKTVFKIKGTIDKIFMEQYVFAKKTYDTTYIADNTVKKDTVTLALVDSFTEIFQIVVERDSITDTIYSQSTDHDTVSYPNRYIVAATTDSISGNAGFAPVSKALADSAYDGSGGLLSLHADSRIFAYKGMIYIIEGAGADNILRVRDPSLSAASVEYKVSVGTGVSLRDISFASETKAYITQYTSDTLAIFNPATHAITGGIDLSAFGLNAGTDSAEVPFMQCSKIYDNTLYVLCRRYKTGEGQVPVPGKLTGLIIVISTAKDSVIDTISLARRSPVSMDIYGGYLYVASTNVTGDTVAGGIEKIDLGTNTNLGLIASIAGIANTYSSIALAGSTKGYVLVTTKRSGNVELYEFNPATGALGDNVDGIDRGDGGLVYDGTYLYAGNRGTANPGVFVINPADNKKVAGPVTMGLKSPGSIAILKISNGRKLR